MNETPLDFSWLYLLKIEKAIELNYWYERKIQDLLNSAIPHIRMMSRFLYTSQLIQEGRTELAFDSIVQQGYEYEFLETRKELNVKPWEPAQFETPINLSNNALAAFIYPYFLACLFIAAIKGENIEKLLSNWKAQCEQRSLPAPIYLWVNFALRVSKMRDNEAVQILYSSQSDHLIRLLAALRFILQVANPNYLFYAQFCWISWASQASIIAEIIDAKALEAFSENWKVMVTRLAYTKNSELSFSEMYKACTLPAKGLKKIAAILLAARVSLNQTVPLEITTELEKIAG